MSNIVNAGNPVVMDENQKNLSLKEIYKIYIITGGQSNPDQLSAIRKLQLTSYLVYK